MATTQVECANCNVHCTCVHACVWLLDSPPSLATGKTCAIHCSVLPTAWDHMTKSLSHVYTCNCTANTRKGMNVGITLVTLCSVGVWCLLQAGTHQYSSLSFYNPYILLFTYITEKKLHWIYCCMLYRWFTGDTWEMWCWQRRILYTDIRDLLVTTLHALQTCVSVLLHNWLEYWFWGMFPLFWGRLRQYSLSLNETWSMQQGHN